MKKPYSLKARVILINNTFLKVSLYKNMFFVKVRFCQNIHTDVFVITPNRQTFFFSETKDLNFGD